jgi:hypothetical protein
MTGGTESEGFPAGTGDSPQGVIRYRKKPVTVETIEWTGENWAAVHSFVGSGIRWQASHGDEAGWIEVWNAQERAWIPCPRGHSVVKGRLGEFYPISPAAIAETYEPAGSPDLAQTVLAGVAAGHVYVSRDDLHDALTLISLWVPAAFRPSVIVERLSAAAGQPPGGPEPVPAPFPVSQDGGERKIDLSASPRSCKWCLWDIIQDGPGRWRLAWGNDGDGPDPYHCDGRADGVHVPKVAATT